MSERPSKRLTAALVRKQLDQILDLLDSLDAAQEIEVGDPLHVTNGSGTWRLDLAVHRLPVQPTLPGIVPPPDAPPPPGDRPATAPFRQVHRKILGKADHVPRPAKELIRASGYKDNSYSWGAITDLARYGLLLRTPDGYVRTPKGDAYLKSQAS